MAIRGKSRLQRWRPQGNLPAPFRLRTLLFRRANFGARGRLAVHALGTVGKRIYACIGLERQSGIVVYDITTPSSPNGRHIR